MAQLVEAFSEEYFTLHYTRSLNDIIKKSGFNVHHLVEGSKSVFDVPGVSLYDLELATFYPDVEFHLFDHNPQCLNALKYIITEDESYLNSLNSSFKLHARSWAGLFDLDINRFHFYEGDLVSDMSIFSKGEFDLAMAHYVFQYIPMELKANALINLGEVSDKVLITKLSSYYSNSLFGKRVRDVFFYEGCGADMIGRQASKQLLSDFLRKKVLLKMVHGENYSIDKYAWVNVNVLGF